MACKDWNDDWVAHLYGELDPVEQRELDAHLTGCSDCRATLDELEATRRLVQEAAPAVPSAPRVVVLRPKPVWTSGWAFAAGAACALILFGSGFFVGDRLTGGGTAEPALDARQTRPMQTESAALPAANDELTQSLREEIRAFEQRLAQLEQRDTGQQVDPQQFEAALQGLERRVNRERAEDLEYVMRSLTAAEMRTGSWMDQTEDALTMLAMRQDPRFTER
jgi:hypothetical protein